MGVPVCRRSFGWFYRWHCWYCRHNVLLVPGGLELLPLRARAGYEPEHVYPPSWHQLDDREFRVEWNALMAGAAIASLPTILIYSLLRALLCPGTDRRGSEELTSRRGHENEDLHNQGLSVELPLLHALLCRIWWHGNPRCSCCSSQAPKWTSCHTRYFEMP